MEKPWIFHRTPEAQFSQDDGRLSGAVCGLKSKAKRKKQQPRSTRCPDGLGRAFDFKAGPPMLGRFKKETEHAQNVDGVPAWNDLRGGPCRFKLPACWGYDLDQLPRLSNYVRVGNRRSGRRHRRNRVESERKPGWFPYVP